MARLHLCLISHKRLVKRPSSTEFLVNSNSNAPSEYLSMPQLYRFHHGSVPSALITSLKGFISYINMTNHSLITIVDVSDFSLATFFDMTEVAIQKQFSLPFYYCV